MNREDTLKLIAPCGLDCTRCADYAHGEISSLSAKLKELLTNYGRVAKLKARLKPEFAAYECFEQILDSLASAACGGCRSESSACPIDCKARTCHKQKKVDFCFECQDYPCADPTFGPLIERWKQKNDRMKEVGVIRFYEEQKKTSRY
jgi:hypothetical protein